MSYTQIEGLGEDLEAIKRLCRDDPKALDAIDRVIVEKPGNPTGNNQYSDNGIDNNVSNSNRANKQGNTNQYALRRLRKLHQKVLNKELSAHKAMISSGMLPKNLTLLVLAAKFQCRYSSGVKLRKSSESS